MSVIILMEAVHISAIILMEATSVNAQMVICFKKAVTAIVKVTL